MEGERTPLLNTSSTPCQRGGQESTTHTRRQLDNQGEDEEDVAEGSRSNGIQRSRLLHTRRQLNEQPEEEEEEVADGPNNCNQWRRQLVGIELVGCLHSFSSGLHEVRHPYPC